MWDAFIGRRNFYTKCKSAVKMINSRMEIIMNRTNAMQKILKSDVADLLRSNLDHNAYGKAEALYVETNLSSCYDYIKECCAIVEDNLKVMHKESACPEECRVAVATLVYAAARFGNLPELRDLREMFTEKYGNDLDAFVSKEFVQKLRSNPPTREMKLQLMKDTAKEFSITWDPASLEHKLCYSAPQQVDQSTKGYKWYRTMSDDNILAKNETKGTQKGVYEHMTSTISRYKEVEQDQRRPFGSKLVPAPYVKPKIDTTRDGSDQDEAPARPNSVRSRFIQRPENVEDTEERHKKSSEGDDDSEQEREVDRLLRYYSMKPWKKASTAITESSWPSDKESESEADGQRVYGISASLYATHMHPKLPDCDELASRIEALRKM